MRIGTELAHMEQTTRQPWTILPGVFIIAGLLGRFGQDLRHVAEKGGLAHAFRTHQSNVPALFLVLKPGDDLLDELIPSPEVGNVRTPTLEMGFQDRRKDFPEPLLPTIDEVGQLLPVIRRKRML